MAGSEPASKLLTTPGELARAGADGQLTSDSVVSIDLKGRVCRWSRGAERMYGYSSEEAVGRDIRELTLLSDEATGDIARAASQEVTRQYEARRRRKDGAIIDVLISSTPWTVDGRVVGLTGVAVDITERKRVEQASASLAAIVQSSDDAIFRISRQGLIESWNPAAERLYGRCAEETIGEPAAVLGRAFTSDRIRLGQDTAPVRIAESAQRRDGATVDTAVTLSPIRNNGRVVGAACIVRDITALTRAQAELESSHAALRRLVNAQNQVQDEERARIARELHDELAQMLAMIRITVNTARRASPDNPERVAELLADAAKLATDAINSTRRIINDLRPAAPEELGLVGALHALAEEFTRRTGVPCEVTVDDRTDDLAQVKPDTADCLYRVAQESLNNVAKHAHARTVGVRISDRLEDVVLTITDDGVGIDASDHYKPNSFGLRGMSERVHAIGGQIVIATQRGSGTTITATAPSASPQ